MKKQNFITRVLVAGFGLALIVAVADGLDRKYPPPLSPEFEVSSEVSDRNGALLRAFATSEGRWRLAVRLQNVDPGFLRMLIA